MNPPRLAAAEHSNRGNALLAAGRMVEAEAAYKAAIKAFPKFSDAHYN